MPQGNRDPKPRAWTTEAILSLVEPQTKRLIRRATTGDGIGGDPINHDDLEGFVAAEHINWTGAADDFKTSGEVRVSNANEGDTAMLARKTVRELHTLAAAGTSDTTTISIPSGARLLAVGMNVDTTVVDTAGDDTWSAAFITGSTTVIVSAAAPAQNTKVNVMLPDEITTGIAEIRFTANGGNFSAGVIEIVVWYEELTGLADA